MIAARISLGLFLALSAALVGLSAARALAAPTWISGPSAGVASQALAVAWVGSLAAVLVTATISVGAWVLEQLMAAEIAIWEVPLPCRRIESSGARGRLPSRGRE